MQFCSYDIAIIGILYFLGLSGLAAFCMGSNCRWVFCMGSDHFCALCDNIHSIGDERGTQERSLTSIWAEALAVMEKGQSQRHYMWKHAAKLDAKDKCSWIKSTLFDRVCLTNMQLSQDHILTETELHWWSVERNDGWSLNGKENLWRSLVAAVELLEPDKFKLLQSVSVLCQSNMTEQIADVEQDTKKNVPIFSLTKWMVTSQLASNIYIKCLA